MTTDTAIDPEVIANTLPCASCGATQPTMHRSDCQRWDYVPASFRPLPWHYECGICSECQDGRFYRCQECECQNCLDWRDDCAADGAAESKSEMERGR